MSTPIVALVGRPNVGKSTLFNKISGRRISIVEDRPGVTRDRVYADAEWTGKHFTVIDTGGIELGSTDEMWMHIKKQAEIAIDMADVIVLIVDVRAGLTSSDYDVADILRKSGKPIVLAVNKLDSYVPEKLYDFYSLGIGEPIGISAEQSQGIGDLLDEVVVHFESGAADDSEYLKIAVVGKPNAGKSSLVNKILGFDRTIVSDIAGTTRDAIDTPFELNGGKYILIDTAGIRRKRSVEDNVEYYSVVRAIGAIKRADVCVLVVDSIEGLTEQDVKICGLIHEEGKPSVIAMNKWDSVEKDTNTIYKFEEKLKQDLKFMDYFRSVYISAKTGLRVDKVIKTVKEVHDRSSYRVGTGVLNEVILDAISMQEPPSRSGKRLKLYYSSQVSVNPPTFVLFVNDAEIMHFSYKRYLENAIRKAFDFSGTPIRIFIREQE